MTFFEAMGLLIGVALLLLGLCALIIRLEKKFPSKHYDERQKEVRGNAYKWVCNFGVVYFATVLLLDMFLPNGIPMDLSLVISIGLALMGFVFAAYCNFRGAYFPLKHPTKANIIILYITGALFLFQGIINVKWLGITPEENHLEVIPFLDVRLGATGLDVLVWLLLIVAVMDLILATVQLIRYMRDQQE